ncbi:VPS20 [[Candida] subhashii]|uniref:VPS20 n=1 Tax=[Candida] subhashii TaxID=561895 RepID=A0A8J5QF58_9ASCO|nr:VPS20 [[Candida] subhashii]KAG7664649.1 VPS20 [[Candida] subhashii]
MGQSTSSTPKITAQDKAIFQLKQQRDNIKKYQRKLQTVIDRQSELARQAVQNKQPERAKFYLRSKKQQQSTIIKTCDQLDNLENLIGTIEFKLIEKDVIYGLTEGNKVLTKLNNEMSVEKIDKIIDQVEEEKLRVDEISEALGMGSGLTKVEETEVDEEFERMNQEINGKQPEEIKMPDVPEQKLPDVPTDKIEEGREEEEEIPAQKAKTHEPIPI